MSWRNDWPVAALTAMAAILIAPLWCVSVPALPDYPAHLASFWLIGGGANPFYHVHWVWAPNLASEIIVPQLARLTGIAVAAKLFLSAAVAMWVLAPGAIQRALTGRLGIAPLFGALFAYNANFFWGFFNYYFAAGLGLVIFAGWIASEAWPRTPRLVLFALAATALYFCHIFAAATLALMLAGFEIMRGSKSRDLAARAVRLALIFAPAAFAFLVLRPAGAGDHGILFDFADSMPDRLDSFILHGFGNPDTITPIAIGAALLLALLLGRAKISRALWLVLALLLVIGAAAPAEMMGGWGVHLRLPALFAALVLAASELKLPPRLAARLAVLALLLAGWAGFTLTRSWHVYDQQTAEFRAAARQLPAGTHLLTVLDGDAIGWSPDPPYWHMAEWTIMDQGAMTALMFATRGQHVVQVMPPWDHFAAATADEGMPPDIDALDDLAAGRLDSDDGMASAVGYLKHFQCHYNEALVIHLGGRRSPVPAMLTLRHAGSFFSLYDIAAGDGCGTADNVVRGLRYHLPA